MIKNFFLFAVYSFTLASLVLIDVASARTCAEAFNSNLSPVFSRENNSREVVIEFLSQDPSIRDLFDADSGFNGHSIRAHTKMVFEMFKEQFPRYKLRFGLQTQTRLRLFETLQVTIALHDIGKPLAIAAGDKNRQHEFTLPILEKQMRLLNFSKSEIKLAKALVGNDLMGKTVRGFVSPQIAFEEFKILAASAGMTIREFFPLRTLFFVSDAGSYSILQAQGVFINDHGMLIPRRSEFAQLLKLIFPDGLGS